MLESLFDIQEILGNGTFSTVYKGLYRDRPDNVITIKRIDKKIHDKWSREIEILQQVFHKNLPEYLGHVDADDEVYVMLKYVQGIDVHAYITTNTIFTIKRIVNIFRQISQVFQYLHGNDIVHLDFKLENIILGENDFITVIDMGFAMRTTGNISLSRGSPEYLSPDILSGKPYNPKQHDIWTMGVVLYVMAYNEYPFEAENDDYKVLYQKIRTQEPKYNSTVPEHINTLIKGMLCKNPKKRLNIDQITRMIFF